MCWPCHKEFTEVYEITKCSIIYTCMSESPILACCPLVSNRKWRLVFSVASIRPSVRDSHRRPIIHVILTQFKSHTLSLHVTKFCILYVESAFVKDAHDILSWDIWSTVLQLTYIFRDDHFVKHSYLLQFLKKMFAMIEQVLERVNAGIHTVLHKFKDGIR